MGTYRLRRAEGVFKMRRMLGVIAVTGLLLGVGAAPAAATGCPTIGGAWSQWAQLGPEVQGSTGEWTADTARTKSVPEGYEEEFDLPEIEAGPGVISRVISAYC